MFQLVVVIEGMKKMDFFKFVFYYLFINLYSCPSCTPVTEKSDDQVKVFDDSHIKKMNRKKRPSSSNRENNHRLLSAGKNSNHYNEKEKNWKILHQEYLQVAVLTNACLWSYAPQGLAKFGHLADGLLDLIVIEPVVRKEFLRYIKRNGNSKNQVKENL